MWGYLMGRAALLLVVAVVILSACGGKSSPSSPPAARDVTPEAATATATPVPVEPLPTAIALPTPEPTPLPPPPAPTPEPPVAEPVRLRIPKINVDAKIIPVGVTPRGEMDSPKDAWSVGWYAPGYKPFEHGNAVMAGHVDFVRIGAAVFFNLRTLVPGDRVTVTGADEQVHEFEVRDVQSYTPENAPLERIFGAGDGRGLNLITCTGTFSASTHDYDRRIVVYTEAVEG